MKSWAKKFPSVALNCIMQNAKQSRALTVCLHLTATHSEFPFEWSSNITVSLIRTQTGPGKLLAQVIKTHIRHS